MRNKCLFILLFGIVLIACQPNGGSSGYRYNSGSLPKTATNLGSINSSYDDYNSTIPTVGGSFPLVFSSNRASGGANFDFVYKWLDVSMSKTTGEFHIGEATIMSNTSAYTANANIDYALTQINTGADELGPNLIKIGYGTRKNAAGYNETYNTYAFLYATNVGGNIDIYYAENVSTGTPYYEKSRSLSFLNSAKDDAYPCITKDSSSIYFCSNRDGGFDIFKADLPLKGGRFINALSDSTSHRVVTKDPDLSSAYDDKCPYITGNTMVFTSNRPGGFGGYDLYYSKFENGKWGAPINFGDKINTASDEYRPIILFMNEGEGFDNHFMLFSSNRPGGKGGFDLYYVGIDR